MSNTNTDKIIKAIEDSHETTKEIVEATGLTPSVVRKDLAKLRKGEAVQAMKVGNTWHHTPLGALPRESDEDLAKATVILKGAVVVRSCPVSVEGSPLGVHVDTLSASVSLADHPITVKPGNGSITIRSINKSPTCFQRVSRRQAQAACASGEWTITSKTTWRRWKQSQG